MQVESLVLLQQVLRELKSEYRGFFRKLTQTFLARCIEQGTTAHKTVVTVVEEHLLLGCQLTVMTVYVFDAFKEAFVQTDIVGVLRQNGTHLLCQSVHLVGSLCRQQVEEHAADTRQEIVVAVVVFLVIDIDDGVVESWFLGVVDDLLYLLIVTTDALHHRLFVVLQGDAVERRRVVRCAIRQEERVLPLILCFHILTLFWGAKVQQKSEK